jgi:hypothetical protein
MASRLDTVFLVSKCISESDLSLPQAMHKPEYPEHSEYDDQAEDIWSVRSNAPSPFITRRTVSPLELADQIRLTSRVHQLEKDLRSLQARCEAFQARIESQLQPFVIEKTHPRIYDVIRLSEELFGVGVTVSTDVDPASPEEPLVTFNVKVTTDDFGNLIERQLAWHERLREIQPDISGCLRLNVEFE